MHKLIQISEDELYELIRKAVREELQAIKRPDGFQNPLNRPEAAKLLGISLSKLDQMTKTGELKSFKIGKSVRYKHQDLENYLNNK